MISSKLFQVTKFWKTLAAPVKFSFATYPSKKQQRMLREGEYKHQVHDDLLFHHERAHFNGGMQAVVEHYKKNVDIDLAPVNAAYLMYNCAVAGLYEPLIFEEIERHIHKFEGKLRPRWAFGCVYGAWKTNAGSKEGLEYFQNELIKRVNDLSIPEITQLIDAICFSTQLTYKEKIRFINEHFLPVIKTHWKIYRSNKSLSFQLIRSLYDLKYFEKDIWDPILESLRTSKQMKEHHLVAEIYETLHKLKDCDFYRDVSDDIAFWAERINSNEDMSYRYSTELKRWYTFQELKAKRDEIRYPDQQLRTHVEELSEEEKRKRRDEEAKKEEERLQIEREKNLTNIVAERYMQYMRGDTDAMYQGLSKFETPEETPEEDLDLLEEVDLDELERTAGSDKGPLTESERRRKHKEDLAKQKKANKVFARKLGDEIKDKNQKEKEQDSEDEK